MNDKISVLVPAYNMAPWIEKTMESILAQSHTNLEVIAVNDGSTDETGRILDGFAARDRRVTVLHQENQGLVAAREAGLRRITGDYVTFVDGDDTVEPDLYQRLLANAKRYDADISHCGISFDYPDGHAEAHYGTGMVLVQDRIEGLQELLRAERIEPSLCSKLYARHLVDDSCLDLTVVNNEDLLRNFVLFDRAERSVFEDVCGYHYYQRPNSLSRSPSQQIPIMHHVFRARRLILDNCPKEVYPLAMRLWLSSYVNAIHSSYADPKAREFVAQCRRILRQERKNIPCLIRRQRWAARLMLYTPRLHRLVYTWYAKRRGSA